MLSCFKSFKALRNKCAAISLNAILVQRCSRGINQVARHFGDNLTTRARRIDDIIKVYKKNISFTGNSRDLNL